MLRDPVEYPQPELFIPERFIVKEGARMPMDPAKITFGFGRRICPGRLLADSTLFLYVVLTLATFDILKERGEDGQVIEPKVQYLSSMIRHPAPFRCKVAPRSPRSAEMVKEAIDAM